MSAVIKVNGTVIPDSLVIVDTLSILLLQKGSFRKKGLSIFRLAEGKALLWNAVLMKTE